MYVATNIIGWLYRYAVKPLLFLVNPETVHRGAVHLGERLGHSEVFRKIAKKILRRDIPQLSQNVSGIEFALPVGLAAGFDYEARLTQILPVFGFGFETIGTLTNEPYEGNVRPMLGRLPKSRALLVNKGFKNLGVAQTLSRLAGQTLTFPVGVSIGKTNTETIRTQQEAVDDVVAGFRAAEASGVPFSYYELNISCPNLKGNIEFYEPKHLDDLLSAVGALALSRPVWVKMPIAKTDDEIRAMLSVIAQHAFVSAVVFGNLQKDRNHPDIIQEEIDGCGKGNISGLPCRERSDELIALAYREFGSRLKIIGCGGIFSAEDAYRKITLGASLVQLITGLVYEGPQLASQINEGIASRLVKDGYTSLAEVIGSASKKKT